MLSPAEFAASHPQLLAETQSLPQAVQAELNWRWRDWWARPNQIAPQGDWATWLILAGRGFGKTRSGAEWTRETWKAGAGRIALVAETAADARDVLVEGQSGILAISPKAERPLYEPSKRRLTWPNGAMATLYNGTEPDQLRGPEHHAAWVDEIAKYACPDDTWDNLQFGLRLGDHPRVCVTTTPRPIPLLRKIIADPQSVVTRGSTYDNAANLPARFLATIKDRYEGTRLGRQELHAEMLDDVVGAIWTRAMIEVDKTEPQMGRVVVAVDPSGTKGDSEESNSVGIVVAGKRMDGRYHVIEDATCDLGPAGWGRRVVEMFTRHKADRIVAESNFGGAMVEAVIRTSAKNVPVKMVSASRGKVVRAEPIAALYEQRQVTHAPGLSALEDQMMQMTLSGYVGGGSPDRVDALVWAMTELALGPEHRFQARELRL
jgi:predicted phage terminase large subunit-like protein